MTQLATLTQEQIHEVCQFQGSLNDSDEWLFFHLAWARSKVEGVVTFEAKYEVMKNWDVLLKAYNE